MLYRLAAAVSLTLSLAACGGGGGGDSSSPPLATPPTLRGVAATGAPLVNAQVTVVDGQGKAIGTATTHAADGSYTITLSSTSVAAPLFIQARGMDAGGVMQVLHSTVPTISAAMVGHVTPLTNAVVALSLGTEPAPVFAAASTSASQLSQMASAVPAASDFVKTLVKQQLTDVKVTDPKTLDLLADATFAANKGAHDLVIEAVRVELNRTRTTNVPVLEISNKFLAVPGAEVVVELPTAQTELLKSSGTPANAITSTLKAATSASTLIGTLAPLDDLGAALNQLIAQGKDAATLLASPLVTGYDKHDGRVKADLAALLATYATANRQFGRFQLLGCADDLPATGTCARVMVGSLISDTSGAVTDVFTDVVSYNKAATTANKWNLVGNGKKLAYAVRPLAYTSLNADGTTNTAQSPDPAIGLQVELQGQALDATQLLSSATVQLPGGFSIPFAYCDRPLMCVSATTGATSAVPAGGVSDIAIQRATIGWIGSADSLRGAKFIANYTLGGSTENRNTYLRADVLAAPAATRFPTLNGLSTTALLTAADLLAGTAPLTWTAWANANPDMRIIEIKRVVTPTAGGAPTVLTSTVPLPFKTTLASLGEAYTPGGSVTAELWLQAIDSQGRRFHTRYIAKP